MDYQDLFIVQEYIRDQQATINKQLEAQRYYENKANSYMNHDFLSLLVDEKVDYLLGKEPTFECSNKTYLEKALEILGNEALYDLQELAREASVKSVGWWQAYIDEKGILRFMLIPSDEVIPVWKDKRHKELDWVIRRYPVTVYEGASKKTRWKVEIYDREYVYFYEEEDGVLRLDAEKYLDAKEGQEISHFYVDDEGYSMGRPPFVFLKNNAAEKSDLDKVKDLIDRYNNNRYRLDEVLEQFKNFLVNVKNYDGNQENENNLKRMLENRIIYTGSDGGVDIITPTVDTQANDSHNQTLKDDIILFGQSVDRNKMLNGTAASGEALKRLYAGLDLKCNGLERELNKFFNQVEYFIKSYLNQAHISVSETDNINIIFNRDIGMNELEAIEMCKSSVGVISSKTIIVNHPWVKDADEEMQQLEEESTTEMNYARKMVEKEIGKNGSNEDEN